MEEDLRNGFDGSSCDWFLPREQADDVFAEIAAQDETYAGIGYELTPSKSGSGIKLCQFRTFSGAMGLQPCIPTAEYARVFKALQYLEANGDEIFKEARAWSCMVQYQENLPTPCRWLAATIYNFAMEVLRPEDMDEARLWRMRAWLHHWYDVADRLFFELNIDIDVPEPDWFQRPTVAKNNFTAAEVNQRAASNPEHHVVVVHSHASGKTFLHHLLMPQDESFYDLDGNYLIDGRSETQDPVGALERGEPRSMAARRRWEQYANNGYDAGVDFS